MIDERDEATPDTGKTGRREFMKKSSQVAMTAPAVAILLNATVLPGRAALAYSKGNDAQTGGGDSNDAG